MRVVAGFICNRQLQSPIPIAEQDTQTLRPSVIITNHYVDLAILIQVAERDRVWAIRAIKLRRRAERAVAVAGKDRHFVIVLQWHHQIRDAIAV